MFVKKASDGNWYVCRRTSRNSRRNWFFIKSMNTQKSFVGKIYIEEITLPQEFLGKKIRLKVEIIKETKDGGDKQ